MREVLPRLLESPEELLLPEMMSCLHGYLAAHQDELDDKSALHEVERRCQASLASSIDNAEFIGKSTETQSCGSMVQCPAPVLFDLPL